MSVPNAPIPTTMDGLRKIRTGLRSSLTKLKSMLDAYDLNNINAAALVTHQARLMELALKFEANHESILLLCPTEAEEQANQNEYEKTDEKIMEMRLFIQECELKLQAGRQQQGPPLFNNGNNGNLATRITLPKLELSKFGGKLEDWMTFSDMFNHAVDSNPDLSGAQKLQYLKSALHGDAARLIESITITDGNYPIAWKAMTDRYQHNREIIHTHVMKIMTLSHVQSDSASSLRQLIDVTNQSLNALRVLQCEPDNWNDILVTVLLNKLDADTRRQYERTLNANDMPLFQELISCLEQQARALSAVALENPNANDAKQSPKPESMNGYHPAPIATVQDRRCSFCQADHFHFQCKMYESKSVAERYDLVKEHRLCINCLRPGHMVSNCNSSSCRKCQRKHHSTLHREEVKREDAPATVLTSHVPSPSQMLLATAVVNIKDKAGNEHKCRAVLDSGSQASFISAACVNRLGLKKLPSALQVTGIGISGVATPQYCVSLTFSSTVYNDASFHVTAVVLPKVTSELPTYHVDSSEWKHIQGLALADPDFQEPRAIDILLGVDILPQLTRTSVLRGGLDHPMAQDSALGWILFGPTTAPTARKIISNVAITEVDAILRKFWEIEDVSTARILTTEEKQCEAHYSATTTRRTDGSYQVQLPFKDNAPVLGDSKFLATKRFEQVERRLMRNPEFREQYTAFMREYLEAGHMRLATPEEMEMPNHKKFYLPHHCVVKEESSTTKHRVVFDASAKTSTGVSLNDTVMIGPVIQRDLFSILVGWRTYIIPLDADIKQMFRFIWLDPAHCSFQRILWCWHPEDTLEEYILLTVTFGLASSPHQAIRTLQQLAEDYKYKYPLASKVVLQDFYADNCLTGASTTSEALVLQSQLMDLMSEANFILRKWSSSDSAVLGAIPQELRETQLPLRLDEDDSIKSLGLFWNPSTDDFKFTVGPAPQVKITKRSILSQVAKVFDPLGLLSPVTIRGKTLMQDLWKLQVGWDQALPKEICRTWTAYRSDLVEISKLRISRCVTVPEALDYQLHVFSDASEKAYAAAVYLRTRMSDGNSSCQLLCSKTKVAPTKQISLPRLELCGAVLLSRLVSVVKTALPVSIKEVHGWTDSTVVKFWLSSPPQRWKTFIANRVTEVQEVIPASFWHHVSGTENPADLPTRGITAHDLLSSEVWLKGPGFLSGTEAIPREVEFPEVPLTAAVQEERKIVHVHLHTEVDTSLLDSYSSLGKVKRITALVQRFIGNLRAKRQGRPKQIGPLKVKELHVALETHIRTVQRMEYGAEIRALQEGLPLSTKSKLLPLSPIIDENGILRVGGRLRKSPLPYNQRHPILLPRSSKLTRLVVEDAHKYLLHGGPQLVLFCLQQRYWIVRGKQFVRSIIHKCKSCVIQRAQTITQQMADLPVHRVAMDDPFTHTGVDYAGPVLMRNMKGRKSVVYKAYIALFVCFSTTAVHLELVSDLSSEAFIAALRRFISRRGRPSCIHSDNGTNFVGANRELEDLVRLTHTLEFNEDISHDLSRSGIQWVFNPPAAPHMGGLWEAGVKATKYHLRRVLGDTALTFEEYSTLLAQVESCLNSRPLCPASADPNDLQSLSPGHFLIGRPLEAAPDPDMTVEKTGRLSRWQLMQQITQHFWQRWSQEYLSRLQSRPKWQQQTPNLQDGDLVVILDERLPPQKWKMARIVELHPGSDGKVRIVSVKTAEGILKRPVVKLCKLPMESATQEESEPVV